MNNPPLKAQQTSERASEAVGACDAQRASERAKTQVALIGTKTTCKHMEKNKNQDATPKRIYKNLMSYIRLCKRIEKNPAARQALAGMSLGRIIQYKTTAN